MNQTNKMFRIYDNIFSEKQVETIHNEIINLSYKTGEVDRPGLPCTGYVSNLTEDNYCYKTIIKKINFTEFFKNKKYNVYRKYVNLFLPNENPYYHIDSNISNSYTILYYSLIEELNEDENGETLFFDAVEKKSFGIFPKKNRMIIFNSSTMHRATSFRTKDRYTIALKIKMI